jgi:hypothetical protein
VALHHNKEDDQHHKPYHRRLAAIGSVLKIRLPSHQMKNSCVLVLHLKGWNGGRHTSKHHVTGSF